MDALYYGDSTRAALFKTCPATIAPRFVRWFICSAEGSEGVLVMLKEFREFIARGNVLDLAVAVIIGAAFATIVTSLTDEIIMPVVGGADFSNYFILLSTPAGYEGSTSDYAALREAGAAMIGYGAFITALINFLILAFVIFLLVRTANKLMRRQVEAPGPTEIDLLTEIRDELRKK